MGKIWPTIGIADVSCIFIIFSISSTSSALFPTPSSANLVSPFPAVYDTAQATTTVLGCKCTSACQTSALFSCDAQSFCAVESKDCASGVASWSISMRSYYDYCIYDAYTPYESLSAQEKQGVVMGLISATAGSEGTYPAAVDMVGVFTESVMTTFQTKADVFPTPPTRVKYIHSVGVVAPFKWVTSGVSKYSGFFKDGADYGIIRLSSATAPTEKNNVTPGAALKLFRDGVPSANFMAMPGVDPQQCSDTNFFMNNFSNHIRPGTGFAKELLETKFWQASRCPQMVGLSDLASSQGQSESVSFPYELILVPRVTVDCECGNYNYCLSGLTNIAAGTTLFDIYAKDTPTPSGCSGPGGCGTEVLIGHFVTTGAFVTSKFGDESLFFAHQYMENDFALHPEWMSQIDKPNDCGMTCVGSVPPTYQQGCNINSCGDRRNVDFNANSVAPCPFEGKVSKGPCPFA